MASTWPGALAAVTTEVASFLGEGAPVVRGRSTSPIAPGHYAEGDDAPDVQPSATHPAIVRVFANRPPERAADLLASVGAAVVRAFGLRGGNVFVRFEPADPDRMFWG